MNLYNVIKKPLLTEKGTRIKAQSNQYCFEVSADADKVDVKKAVEKLFNVKVAGVRTMNYSGKKKRVGRSVGTTKSWKKAVVRLKEGSTIEFFEGV